MKSQKKSCCSTVPDSPKQDSFFKMAEVKSCCSGSGSSAVAAPAIGEGSKIPGSRWVLYAGLIPAWLIMYFNLELFAEYLTYTVLGFSKDSLLGSAIEFFIYDAPKIFMLMILVVFAIGVVRSFFTPESTRKFLAGKRELFGTVLAAFFGILTPFCTCSAVPLFIGFVAAGIPLGVTFSYLISAPLVNEIALVLLYGLFGWKVAAVYLAMGLLIAMVSGWILGRLRMEGHFEEWVYQIRAGEAQYEEPQRTWSGRFQYGIDSVYDIVGKVWKYVLLGIAVGAFIHGYVPEGFMASIMGKDAWWSVPAAVIVGIPMYSSGAGIIPVVQALLGKGAALGTVLAFMMAVIALSLPEAILLRKVLKPKLLATFFGVVGFGIMIVGYIFNILF